MSDLSTLIKAYFSAQAAWRKLDEEANGPTHESPEWKAYEDAEHAVLLFPCATMADVQLKAQFVLLDDSAYDSVKNCIFLDNEEDVLKRFLLAFFEVPAPHPDADLIELGRQFEAAKEAAQKLDPERRRTRAVFEDACKDADIPDDWRGVKAKKPIAKATGYRKASADFNKAHGVAWRLMKAIHRAKATTLEGFAVKAAAIAFDQSDFDVTVPVPSDVTERELYRLARDMAKVVKAGGANV